MPPNNPPAAQTPDSPEDPARRWPLGLHHRGAQMVIGLVIIGLILISYLGLKNRQTAPAPASNHASVIINSAGFVPAEIAVKAGTQITWINNDSVAHEVAADPYPKNNSIPGFNSTDLLQTNDSYSFMFDKAGTYHYHDQLNPLKLLGTVVVR